MYFKAFFYFFIFQCQIHILFYSNTSSAVEKVTGGGSLNIPI